MKNMQNKTLIFYTFQSSNKSAQYNVTSFKKSSPQQPKIRDVLYQLPIDYQQNSYHFRFKSQFVQGQDKIVGWIDISNLLSKVPLISGNIFVKILQLPGDHQNKLFNKQKLRAIGLLDPKGASTTNTTAPRNYNNGTVNNSSNVNNTTTPQTPSNKNPTNMNIDVKNKAPTTQPQPQPTQQPQPQTRSNVDIINLHKSTVNIDQPSPLHKKAQSQQTTKQKPNSTQKLKLPKPYIPGSQTPQQRLQGFQNQIKKQEQQQQLQRKAITFHQAKLTQWGYSGHKTINNLTTLLATLHVIWPQWQPVSLSDMLTPQAVGSVYKKAVVRLHPDKNRDKDYFTKYLSKRIFQLLNEAKKAQK